MLATRDVVGAAAIQRAPELENEQPLIDCRLTAGGRRFRRRSVSVLVWIEGYKHDLLVVNIHGHRHSTVSGVGRVPHIESWPGSATNEGNCT